MTTSYEEDYFDFLKNETDIFARKKHVEFIINPEEYYLDHLYPTEDVLSSASTSFDNDLSSEISHDLNSPFPFEENEALDFLSDKTIVSIKNQRESLQENINRYREKRERRIWRNRVIYKVRQKLAIERPRKNGRFFKSK